MNKEESKEPKNMAEALLKEIKRNRELLEEYRKIPTGWFGAAAIEADLEFAEAALASGDVIEILKAYGRMENNE
jgi:hypothetical protein